MRLLITKSSYIAATYSISISISITPWKLAGIREELFEANLAMGLYGYPSKTWG